MKYVSLSFLCYCLKVFAYFGHNKIVSCPKYAKSYKMQTICDHSKGKLHLLEYFNLHRFLLLLKYVKFSFDFEIMFVLIC